MLTASSTLALAELAVLRHPGPSNVETLGPVAEGELPGFLSDFSGFSAGHTLGFFQRNRHEAIGALGDIFRFAERLDREIAPYLRADIDAHLRHVKRELRRFDAAVVIHYFLPNEHPAHDRWT